MKKPKKEDVYNETERTRKKAGGGADFAEGEITENPIIDDYDDDEEVCTDQYKDYSQFFKDCPTCGRRIDTNYRKLELN